MEITLIFVQIVPIIILRMIFDFVLIVEHHFRKRHPAKGAEHDFKRKHFQVEMKTVVPRSCSDSVGGAESGLWGLATLRTKCELSPSLRRVGGRVDT